MLLLSFRHSRIMSCEICSIGSRLCILTASWSLPRLLGSISSMFSSPTASREPVFWEMWVPFFLRHLSGDIFQQGQLSADPVKVRAMAEWPTAFSKKQLQQFLGFANFYCRFIQNYNNTGSPYPPDVHALVLQLALWWVLYLICPHRLTLKRWARVSWRSSSFSLSSRSPALDQFLGRQGPTPFFSLAEVENSTHSATPLLHTHPISFYNSHLSLLHIRATAVCLCVARLFITSCLTFQHFLRSD